MSIQGVHHIGITTGHFADTVRLYEEGLGFTIKHTWGRDKKVYMMETGDGTCVEVFEGEEAPAASHAQHANGEWMHLALRSADIHADYARALAAGAKPKLPPTYADILEATPQPVYMWFAYLIGYDGEEIELIQELEGPAQ
ncbi:MAG: VOC family protein [Gemmiger sp.]|nr:VOC family protein [Gemmiger sp.]